MFTRFLVACFLITVQAVPSICQNWRGFSDEDRVRLQVLGVEAEKDQLGRLAFSIKLRLSNETKRAIWIETLHKDAHNPDFPLLEKKLNYHPLWLHLWPFEDVPATYAFDLKPGESVSFEARAPCVSSYRMPFNEGIPVRGVHRVKLRYYLTRADFDRVRDLRKAPIYWAVSGEFRIDWPGEASFASCTELSDAKAAGP